MSSVYVSDIANSTPCACDNCEWKGPAELLEPIHDIEQRLDPGGTVPAGECPECGALAYIVKELTREQKLVEFATLVLTHMTHVKEWDGDTLDAIAGYGLETGVAVNDEPYGYFRWTEIPAGEVEHMQEQTRP